MECGLSRLEIFPLEKFLTYYFLEQTDTVSKTNQKVTPFKEVVSHVTYSALFSQLSCHCHMISAHSRRSAHWKRRCAVVLSLELLVLGTLAWLVLRWHILVAPCGQTIHFVAKNQRERERARGKGPMVPPPPEDLMSCWATWASVSRYTHTHACKHTHTQGFILIQCSLCNSEDGKYTVPFDCSCPNPQGVHESSSSWGGTLSAGIGPQLQNIGWRLENVGKQ